MPTNDHDDVSPVRQHLPSPDMCMALKMLLLVARRRHD
jgi:hypothetical protein